MKRYLITLGLGLLLGGILLLGVLVARAFGSTTVSRVPGSGPVGWSGAAAFELTLPT
jgi:hypothetical protein